ncbi:hypothetical protein XAC2852_790027 [Xanthomonas citri pv. citri]|uniref:Uncharacterized protein n=1 Tax=Xanthomonas citri pv. citri TaxID=611301 RepID=A0A0U5FIH2_XANCI|nr:hypothetical protein XAC902_1040027 [Xanthomonas citri pv. citri]CEE20373.1 hypothetical protein XAC908_1020027 [Xanthomonas citri pv. citri]CEE37214.1 hypothetical protein XAC3824_880026 [Xanthomonas citri pv. citri]CEE38418.1 hypothetical protein XAC1083_720027 [Xanthomonas citri pv. citri]CEE48047.1 hypothetical protein XAC2911_790027 [Xanthomonas citri pv. citri]
MLRVMCWRSANRPERASAPSTWMLPASGSRRPRMLRISTDLPVPEPPTTPRISPRRTSRSRSSCTVWLPKRLVSPRTEIASCSSSTSACGPGSGRGDSGLVTAPSSPIPMQAPRCGFVQIPNPECRIPAPSPPHLHEPQRRNRVENDDQGNRLHHRGGGAFAHRLRGSADLQPFQAADQADHQRKQRRLREPDQEMPQLDGVVHARQIHLRRNIQVERAHGDATGQAGDHRDEGQQRQGEDQREQARDHQQVDRVQAQRTDRVHFLARFHRTDLRGEGAGGAACQNNCRQQHREFAQEGDGHQLHHINFRTEVAQDGRAQEGDHRAHQIRQQHHQRHRVQAHLLHVMHGGGQPEAPRLVDQPHDLDQVFAQKTVQLQDVLADAVGGPAQAVERGDEAVIAFGLGALVVEFLDGAHQCLVLIAKIDRVFLQAHAAGKAQQLQYAGRIQLLDAARVDAAHPVGHGLQQFCLGQGGRQDPTASEADLCLILRVLFDAWRLRFDHGWPVRGASIQGQCERRMGTQPQRRADGRR